MSYIDRQHRLQKEEIKSGKSGKKLTNITATVSEEKKRCCYLTDHEKVSKRSSASCHTLNARYERKKKANQGWSTRKKNHRKERSKKKELRSALLQNMKILNIKREKKEPSTPFLSPQDIDR